MVALQVTLRGEEAERLTELAREKGLTVDEVIPGTIVELLRWPARARSTIRSGEGNPRNHDGKCLAKGHAK